ncbi:FG-GAP repeat [Carpediemonas membranifera]|uniref:FG-GAP repeat n=1 Tax=Carpediemonas membranifera TaxID=201153 RepID=A0A8J6E3I3_9EUKA|nr:FG-GAP repeat [Carpediemonas membranifera]|eukprot:KAG9395651.1 FG-GAP repeat [Carpediemonas membranifera]
MSQKFGTAVAFTNDLFAIGDPGYDDGSQSFTTGAVFIFSMDDLTLATYDTVVPQATVFSDQQDTPALFGSSLAFSANDTILIGMPGAYCDAYSAITGVVVNGWLVASWQLNVLKPQTAGLTGFGKTVATTLDDDDNNVLIVGHDTGVEAAYYEFEYWTDDNTITAVNLDGASAAAVSAETLSEWAVVVYANATDSTLRVITLDTNEISPWWFPIATAGSVTAMAMAMYGDTIVAADTGGTVGALSVHKLSSTGRSVSAVYSTTFTGTEGVGLGQAVPLYGGALATPAGFYQPHASSLGYVPCNTGYYCHASGLSAKTPAEPGYYVPASERGACTEQTACLMGHYQPNSTASSCAYCDGGYYCPNEATAVHTPTDPGYYTPSGSPNAEQLECYTGTYQPNNASSSCISCNGGYYCPEAGATTRLATDPGHFAPANEDCIDQTACYAGTYQPNSISSECLDCNSGYYCPDLGSTNRTAADPGHYVPTTGGAYSSQYPCGYGTSTGEPAQTSCPACPAGTWTIDTGGDLTPEVSDSCLSFAVQDTVQIDPYPLQIMVNLTIFNSSTFFPQLTNYRLVSEDGETEYSCVPLWVDAEAGYNIGRLALLPDTSSLAAGKYVVQFDLQWWDEMGADTNDTMELPVSVATSVESPGTVSQVIAMWEGALAANVTNMVFAPTEAALPVGGTSRLTLDLYGDVTYLDNCYRELSFSELAGKELLNLTCEYMAAASASTLRDSFSFEGVWALEYGPLLTTNGPVPLVFEDGEFIPFEVKYDGEYLHGTELYNSTTLRDAYDGILSWLPSGDHKAHWLFADDEFTVTEFTVPDTGDSGIGVGTAVAVGGMVVVGTAVCLPIIGVGVVIFLVIAALAVVLIVLAPVLVVMVGIGAVQQYRKSEEPVMFENPMAG